MKGPVSVERGLDMYASTFKRDSSVEMMKTGKRNVDWVREIHRKTVAYEGRSTTTKDVSTTTKDVLTTAQTSQQQSRKYLSVKCHRHGC